MISGLVQVNMVVNIKFQQRFILTLKLIKDISLRLWEIGYDLEDSQESGLVGKQNIIKNIAYFGLVIRSRKKLMTLRSKVTTGYKCKICKQ